MDKTIARRKSVEDPSKSVGNGGVSTTGIAILQAALTLNFSRNVWRLMIGGLDEFAILTEGMARSELGKIIVVNQLLRHIIGYPAGRQSPSGYNDYVAAAIYDLRKVWLVVGIDR
jgi:hypothetical protein